VVARRVGAAPAAVSLVSRAATLVAAAAALLLPIAAACGFVVWKGFGTRGASTSTEPYAAIEIGSKGVKYVWCRVTPSEGGPELLPLEKESENTSVVQGMEKTGLFDPAGLKDTVKVVAKFHELLVEKRQVAPERIFVVGSSGLFGALQSRKGPEKDELLEKNKADLSEAVRKEIGKKVDFVDLEMEAQYQLRGMVRGDLDSALFIDVGGGSSRAGYREPTGVIRTLQGPGVTAFYGTVKGRVKPPAQLADVAGALARDELRPTFRKQTDKNPGLLVPDKVYFGGGIAWVMATCLHPASRGPRVALAADDVDDFAERVRKDPRLLESFAAPPSLSEKDREELEIEIKRMRKNFNPEQLIAGAELLKALSAELELGKKKERWWFRHSDVAWVLAYLEERTGVRK
jgi:hypothetical protein